MNLKWRLSYETIKFNTPDGDLSKGQYAVAPKGGFYVRRHPQNNYQFLRAEKLDPTLDIEEVQIVEGESMFYDEFELPNKRILRFPSTQNDYRALAVKNASGRNKDVTSQEIQEITKDDDKWADIPITDKLTLKQLRKGGIVNGTRT